MANEFHDDRGAHVIEDDGALRAVAGDRWQISRTPGLLRAERRSADGRSVRYVVAFSASELARKLTAIEAEA